MPNFSSWEAFAAHMRELNALSVFVRLFLSVAFGAILGINRSRRNRPAGLRTHMLVCMGATLVMITNQYITMNFTPSDPARMGAQVISGIGFLGAGTIIVTRSNQVLGLTTAAGLWACACLGLALGIGFYSGAIVAEFMIIFIVVTMHRLDARLHDRSRVMTVFAEFGAPAHLSAFIAFCHENGMRISHVEMIQARESFGSIAAIITIKLSKRFDHLEIVQRLGQLEGLVFIEEV